MSEPTKNGPSGFGTGTGAVNDSLLAAVLPVEQRIACIEMLLTNAASPWEPSSNRDSYFIAASNLTDDLDEEHRGRFLNVAMNFAASPPPSQADAFNASMSSPLGAMRMNDRSDCRPAATFFAARLARSSEEKRLVRDAALRLIGVGSDDDYRVSTTLQLVQSELGDGIGLLAQGSWTLRSLAAILWAESTDMPDELGRAFSQDRDVRVRRALANALANAEHRQGRRCSRRTPARSAVVRPFNSARCYTAARLTVVPHMVHTFREAELVKELRFIGFPPRQGRDLIPRRQTISFTLTRVYAAKFDRVARHADVLSM